METGTISSILIVRLSAIGDVIHALPVLEELRRAFPEARIGWVVEELSSPLLENHPQLDKVYVIPKKRWKKHWFALWKDEIKPFFQKMKDDKWDVAIDLQGLTKSGFVAKMSGAPKRIGFADEGARELNSLFTNQKVQPPTWCEHVVERNLSLLEGLGISVDRRAHGQLYVSEEERSAMREQLIAAGWDGQKPLLAVNPGAGWVTKQWKPERYAETAVSLAQRKKMLPLVLWGPGEEEMRDRIKYELGREKVNCVLAPPTNLRQLAAIISLCSMYIGGDTGPSHMAGILDIPNVAVFGASDAKRNRPWPRENGNVIQQTDLACVPCWKKTCKLQDQPFLCLRKMKAGLAYEAAVQLLDRDRRSRSSAEVKIKVKAS